MEEKVALHWVRSEVTVAVAVRPLFNTMLFAPSLCCVSVILQRSSLCRRVSIFFDNEQQMHEGKRVSPVDLPVTDI